MVRRDHPALTGELRLLVRDRRPAFQEPAIDHLLTILPHASLVPVGRGEALDCDMLFHTFDQRARPIDHFAFGNAIRALGPIYRERYGVNIARTSRRLYLSRANQKSRRMVNEGEVERTLERHGFESIRPEELSHPEQVALFAEASDIVATTGAALTNLLFCQPGTRVIEIRPSDFRYPLWLGLCLQMGHEHRGLIGSATDIHRDLLVDTAELEREIASFAG